MAQKMYGHLQEKYENIVFQILKIYKAFSNFDYNSTIREKIHWIVQLFGNKSIGRFSLTNQTCKLIHPLIHAVSSTLFLDNKEN